VRPDWRGVLLIAVQLGLAILVVRTFRLENRALYHVLVLAGAGFLVHAFLPRAWQLGFFALLSVASVLVVLELPGLWVLGVGGLLIGLCHLPVRFGVRVALVLAVGGGCALIRVGWGPELVPGVVWPVVGSMFMFRLALYLYSVRAGDAQFGWTRAAAYFFMAPNASFPLYPVVDYKTFGRTWFDQDPLLIYDRGMRWIFRGIVHLLLYRFVYYNLTLDPADLDGLSDLVQYLVTTFLLYLRVSGQFHLIVGLLHLFGFRLPETHHLYYLAASFTDFWRRINIYWKDFMMKLVYYPSFFWLRRYGNTTALVLSTLIVFLGTWWLHAYQWFWLRGQFPVTATDSLFWGLLAVLVVINSLVEARQPRQRNTSTRWSGILGLKTVATFVVICLLWSLWNSETLAEWLALGHVARQATVPEVLALAALLGLAVLVAGRPWGAPALAAGPAGPPSRAEQWRGMAFRAGPLALFVGLGDPALQPHLGTELAPVVRSLRGGSLSAHDEATLQRGYYEGLNNVNRFGSQLWEIIARRPPEARELEATPAHRPRKDLLLGELVPHFTLSYMGQPFSVNAGGMRDRHYELRKDSGTVRIAVLGPSVVMGYGVADGETFESQLEDHLNQAGRRRYEVLNFGFEGHSLLQQLATLETRVFEYQPDVVLVSLTPIEHRMLAANLRRAVRADVDLRYPEVRRVVEQAGITAQTPPGAALRQLRPHDRQLMRWALRRLYEISHAHGAMPLAIALRLPTQPRARLQTVIEVAQDAGFPVLDLTDAYEGEDEATLRATEWDRHPNARGHRLITERLVPEFRRHWPAEDPPGQDHSQPRGAP